MVAVVWHPERVETLRIGPGVPARHPRRFVGEETLARTFARGVVIGLGIGLGFTVWVTAGSWF